MRVCGIVAEYDPFHAGHLYHLGEARRQSGADFVVCVISTAFTQRGTPGLFSTKDRAHMVLLAGADLVLGMPVSYACAQANRFALGGVGILDALGVVTHLAFGVEVDALPRLQQAAQLLHEEGSALSALRAQGLQQGLSYARAQGEALKKLLGAQDGQNLDRPNFNLGVSYLLALSRLKSSIAPLPIGRAGSYHDTRVQALPSATAVRGALLRGDWQAVSAGLPDAVLPLVRQAVFDGRLCRPGALDQALLTRLLQGGEYASLAEMSEGLDQRILKFAPLAADREMLISLVKTKRYPHARISRALSGILLGLQKQPLRRPAYARLLGMRRGAEPLLRAIDKAGFPLVSRPAKEQRPEIRQDMWAEALWHMGAGLPAAQAYQQKIIKL